MDVFRQGWYSEVGKGITLSVKVEKVLYHEKSKPQDILVFECQKWGRVLAVDDTVQHSQIDECSHHEIIAFLALNSHPDPKKVLIIGGGLGGTLREVTKHPLVQSIDICEIDEKVHAVSKDYLPFLAEGFESVKYKLHFCDGADFVKNYQQEYDVIIVDSPAPKGVGARLFENAFYKSLKSALAQGGIVISRGGSFWYDQKFISDMIKMFKTHFPVVDYGTTYITSYLGGQVGYLCCSSNPETNFRKPLQVFSYETMKQLQLKYYTPDIHRAAFALPLKISEALGLSWEVE